MRLWHQSLIPYLDRQRLLGVHRECCALRGKGWGKKHATVDYIFKEPNRPEELVAYHMLVMDEMEKRGYHPNSIWRNYTWRGASLGMDETFVDSDMVDDQCAYAIYKGGIIYPEHDISYLADCLDLLMKKEADCDWKGIVNSVIFKLPTV